jgi:hypothetical protein
VQQGVYDAANSSSEPKAGRDKRQGTSAGQRQPGQGNMASLCVVHMSNITQLCAAVLAACNHMAAQTEELLILCR